MQGARCALCEGYRMQGTIGTNSVRVHGMKDAMCKCMNGAGCKDVG